MKKKISKTIIASFLVCAFASVSYADGWYPQSGVVKEFTDSCAAFLSSLASFGSSGSGGLGVVEPGVAGLGVVEPGDTDSNHGDKPPMNPVPEPATMLLFGAGIAGLAGAMLRKKNK